MSFVIAKANPVPIFPYEGVASGVWWIAPDPRRPDLGAFVSCPICATVSCLSRKVHEVDRKSCKTKAGFRCRKEGCGFADKLYLDGWEGDGWELYAVLSDKWEPALRMWLPMPLEYMHAMSQEHALRVARHGAEKGTRVVTAAKALGFIAEDEHGERLIA